MKRCAITIIITFFFVVAWYALNEKVTVAFVIFLFFQLYNIAEITMLARIKNGFFFARQRKCEEFMYRNFIIVSGMRDFDLFLIFIFSLFYQILLSDWLYPQNN